MGRSRYLLVALALGATQPAVASDFSANIGMMSDYLFRGIKQNTSASAFGGLDYEHSSGLFVGTWAAEVGEGIEYDLYGGYGGSVGDFSYSVGYTGYFYTDDFDDTYQEINLNLGYGLFSLEYSRGEYDNFDGPTLDYGFWAGTVEYQGFYATYGTFANDFEGDYFEVGYGTEVAGLDLGIAAVYSDSDLAPGDSGETTLYFTISKTFDLR
ncbi:MAG: TorF family putative porin [Gammaproteobacteria bacterium]